jgi:MYXO-CTERM domain-containing protein
VGGVAVRLAVAISVLGDASHPAHWRGFWAVAVFMLAFAAAWRR